MALKQRRAAQIEHTVTTLHEHGTVWGDAKPDNLVVDLDGKIWVVDVGGGLTEGWVEPSMFHTEERDLHALAKMKEGLR
jgi:tRNA A-37 threonylcarbamoyl transferase component Bud32